MKFRQFQESIARLVDVLVAPSDAFEKLLAQPEYSVAIVLTLVLRLVVEAVKAPVRIADGFVVTPLTDCVSAVMVGLGWSLWIAVVFFGVSRAFKCPTSWRGCLALASHIAFVMVGVSALVEAAVICVFRIQGVAPHLVFLLPSLGWLFHTSLGAAFANLSIFTIWGMVLAFLALRRVGLSALPALGFALIAAAGPNVAYTFSALWIQQQSGQQ